MVGVQEKYCCALYGLGYGGGLSGKKKRERMDFLNQSWFWVGLFTTLASLGGVLLREWHKMP
jgi:hypothetical protein